MTKLLETLSRGASVGAFAAMSTPHMPRINFGPADELGNGAGAGDEDTTNSDDTTDADAAGDDTGDENDGDASGDDGASKTEAEKKLLRDVMAKKGKLKEAQTEIDTLKASLAKFDGINVDEVRALLTEKKNSELAAEEAKGNFDRVKQMMVEAHDADKKTLTDQIADLQAQLATAAGTIDELTVGRSFSESKYISEELVLTPAKARQLYGAHFGIEDGKIVAYDKPKSAADRTLYIGGDGNPLSFEDAMKKLIAADPDRDALVKVTVKPGAGSSTKKVEEKPNKDADSKLFGVSRIAFALENQNK